MARRINPEYTGRVECPACESQNPDDKIFCGDCGARLSTEHHVPDASLQRQIEDCLTRKFKDQKLVEFEVTDLVFDNVMKWAKRLSYFAGIPIAVLLVLLGVFGIKKYSDLWQLASAAEAKIKPAIQQAAKQADDLNKDTDNIRKRTEAVQKQLAELEPQIASIRASSERVANLENAFNAKVASLQSSVDNKVKGIQGQVNQLKDAIEIVGRRFTPTEFRQYVKSLDFSTWHPQFVVLHNTFLPKLAEWRGLNDEQKLQKLRGLSEYYGATQHWSAGPHLFIDQEGIWVFSPLTRPGVHSPSWNQVSIGADMVGDYSSETFDPAVRENTVQAIAILDAALGVTADSLKFHREDLKSTHRQCPGNNVNKDDLVQRIQALLHK